MKILAEVIPNSNGDAIRGLDMLISELGIPTSLRELGLKEGDIEKAAEIVVSKPFWNLRKVEKDPIVLLIRRAWVGEATKSDI